MPGLLVSAAEADVHEPMNGGRSLRGLTLPCTGGSLAKGPSQ